jgi:hypothetical protein
MAVTYKSGIIGVSNAGSAPPTQTRRKYDRSDKVWMKALADGGMLQIMTQKLQKRPSGDIKYYMWEDDYYIQSGTLKGCDVNGNDAAITTSTVYFYVLGSGSEAANTFLQVGDKLHIPSFQTYQTNTQGTGGTTDGVAHVAGEDVIIREVVSANVVRVTRNGGAGTQAGNVTAASATYLNWEWKVAAFSDGSGSPSAIGDSMDEDYNYREIMRLSWDISGRNVMQDMYAGSDLQRLRVKKRAHFFRGVERKFWTNHRGISYGANGLEESHTGGMFEYIADTSTTGTRVAAYDASEDLVSGTGTQRVWLVNKNFNLNNLDKFLERSHKYGSKNKILIGGRGLVTKMQSLLRPYYGGFDWSEDQYGFAVAKVKCAFGVLPLMIEQEWSNGANAYDYWMAVIDLDHIGYRYGQGKCVIKGCGNSNSDLHVHEAIQAADEFHQKDELFADIGFHQVFRKSHSLMIWDGTE